MFMRHSFRKEDWWVRNINGLCNSLVEMMGWRQLVEATPNFFEGFWHATRLYEYPWVVHTVPPKGKILDIGSNAQFHVALLGVGCEVTAHYTLQDIPHIGLMDCRVRGYQPLARAYEKAGRRITWVYGFLEDLPLEANSYDIIYCISVIEHVPPEYVDQWMAGMWRLLKPKGKLVFTVDYFPAFSKGCGLSPYGWNLDWGPTWDNDCLTRCITEELPWHPDYDLTVEADKDVVRVIWEPMGDVLVYGFVLEKPL